MALTSAILRVIVDNARTALTATVPGVFITITDQPDATAAASTTPAIQFSPISFVQTADRNGWGCGQFVFRVTAWIQQPRDPANEGYFELSSTLSPQALVETVSQAINNTVPTGAAGPIAKRTGPTDVVSDRRTGMARSEAEFWVWAEETWTP